MNISKITIARLYNLGNYEHVRYELTADVQNSDSATTAIIAMERILAALNPRRPEGVPSVSSIRSKESYIESLKEHILELQAKSTAEPDYAEKLAAAKLALDEDEKELITARETRAKWKQIQTDARQQLDDLRGAAIKKDAKEDWDMDSQE